MSKSSVFKLRLKVLNSSAERQLCDSEFQTEGALTLKALADNESAIRGTEIEYTVCLQTVVSFLVGSPGSGERGKQECR